eukprot:GCRY01002668.1.p1 GENE.GCRY01002668.1~~GCRY01002668.1.p1  ORF type:complete len:220 (-),score=39.83 GCRY01002668.1:170-829(-)
MKFLDCPAFSLLNNLLEVDMGDYLFQGKIEAYSCKMAGADKKLYKSYDQCLAASPPPPLSLSVSPGSLMGKSPFGKLDEATSRHTLIFLISTLNASYPDYDFSNLKAEDFRKESCLPLVVNSIDHQLHNVLGEEYLRSIKEKLWSALDTEIVLQDSLIYSFIPDQDSDPFQGLWSFNYFFYNKKLKRLVFFTCRGVTHDQLDDDQEMEFEDEPMMEMDM